LPAARGRWPSPAAWKPALVLAQPHHDRVFFAGEATDPVWATRVGGAYASGLRAAGEALAMLGQQTLGVKRVVGLPSRELPDHACFLVVAGRTP